MNVRDLIRKLQKFSPTVPVMVSQEFGTVDLEDTLLAFNGKRESCCLLKPTYFRRPPSDKTLPTRRSRV